MRELITIKEASNFASKHITKDLSASNMTYLLNYGNLEKIGDNGTSLASKTSLIEYCGTCKK